MNILGESTVVTFDVQDWLATKNPAPLMYDLMFEYFEYAPERGVRPEVAFAQSCKETGFGRFGRAVTPEHRNPCGLKVTRPVGPDHNPDDHARFPTWDVGVIAHVDHLALYAGAPSYPREDTPDPRHFTFITGRAKTVEELGGKWAPAPSYGKSIVRMVEEMEAIARGPR
jgi:hypothetical protein